MTIIHTRQNKLGNWWCSGTIDGVDVAFSGFTAVGAQDRMRQHLKGDEAKWLAPITYIEQLKKEANTQQIIASTTRLTNPTKH